MGKKRAALKYGAAGAVTALYVTGTVRNWMGKDSDTPALPKEKLAIVAGTVTLLTWVAALA